MTMITAWVLILLMIIINHHVSSTELNTLDIALKDALYERGKVETEETDGVYLDVATYRGIGKRQTLLGFTSIVTLLYMFTTEPFYDYYGNVAMFFFNGVIILALIGYLIEGQIMWSASMNNSYEDEEEQ